ncbi:class I SAM-dependent methyltransferase [Streptomyces sp. ST2-7A]|uniref:class I SAM-dependent methyltransferase n=1 Tax=Streptomyces sp. ST2-7A TaxID=2907214 RepID=UPI001F18DAF5|nr:methyltransferase domain-containing protein [Streptomyces sp. ST2-7A]MCE7082623.1 methyltransferase domain-containing protein [Streptomyces sp. ST2-7A]
MTTRGVPGVGKNSAGHPARPHRRRCGPRHRLRCGQTRASARRSRRRARTGLAISDVELQRAAERAVGAGRSGVTAFRNADVRALPFDDDSFDDTWASESMLHVPGRGRALAGTAGALRPDGRPVIADTSNARRRVPKAARRSMERTAYHVTSFATAAKYSEPLTANGFVDVEIRGISDKVVKTGSVR